MCHVHAILCLESVNIYVLTMKHDAWWAVFLLNCGTHLQWSESLSVNIPKQLNPWHTKNRPLQGEPHSYPYKMGSTRITRVHMGWQIIITFPSKYEFPGQILSESYCTFPSATDVLILVSYQFMICKSVCHFFLQHYLDPPKEMKKALESKGLPLEDFFVMKHGESRLLLEEMEMDWEWCLKGPIINEVTSFDFEVTKAKFISRPGFSSESNHGLGINIKGVQLCSIFSVGLSYHD